MVWETELPTSILRGCSKGRNHSSDSYRSGDCPQVAQRTFWSDVSTFCFMGVTVVKARKKLLSALFTICKVYINLSNVSLGHRNSDPQGLTLKNCHQQKVTIDSREGHSNQCQGEPGSPGLCSFRQPASQEGVCASTQLPRALSALSSSAFSLLFPTSGEHPCRSHSTHPMPSLGRAPNNPLPIVQESGNTQAREDMRL